jgi:uncharacterized protein (DUF1499 family)
MTAFAMAALLALSVHLPDCPGSPNCVSSLASDPARRVEPFSFQGHTPEQARKALVAALTSMRRTEIVAQDPMVIEALARSRLFGFVDEITFAFDDDGHVVHVRSASRNGYWDLGANARRVEILRQAFAAALQRQMTLGSGAKPGWN